MPDLSKLPLPEHQANQPYHWTFDNLPLKTLAERDEVINNAVDRQTQIMNAAAGNQGSIANRLNQSIEENGDLRPSAIDQALHNVAEHSDGSRMVSAEELSYYIDTLGYSEISNPVSFVRMLESERDKLAAIPGDSTNIRLEFCTNEGCTSSQTFEEGVIRFEQSSFISWEVSANRVKPILSTSMQGSHQHFYDIEPIYDSGIYTASVVPYKEGSLRVYVNGIRLVSGVDFTPNHSAGTFVLSEPIESSDVIRVDYDRELV